MRSLSELVETYAPTIGLLRQWIAAAENRCEVLPAADDRVDTLVHLQVTTHSTLGAIANGTGGILIDDGWLRVLGSGHPRLRRSLARWNEGRASGFFLVADDAVGGFFALNGGAFGEDIHNVYYWPPDSTEWESLKMGFTEFFQAALTPRLAEFYETLRWPTWKADIAELPADRCWAFYPFLWTVEGSIEKSVRRDVPVAEAFDFKADMVRQLGELR